MNPGRLSAYVLGAGLAALCARPAMAEQSYIYSVLHPFYGDVGTFTHTVERAADVTHIDTHLRIAVRLLGVVAYREESDGTEVLRGGRLLSLQNLIDKNGTHSEVQGEARGDGFVVKSPAGTFTAPADVAPSDPWLLKETGVRTVVSTKSGKVETARILGGNKETISLSGVPVTARHFIIDTDKRQEVWLDSHDVPIMFRTPVNGTRIDFVLKTPLPPDVVAQVNSRPSTPSRSDK